MIYIYIKLGPNIGFFPLGRVGVKWVPRGKMGHPLYSAQILVITKFLFSSNTRLYITLYSV